MCVRFPVIRKLLEDHDPATKSWKWRVPYSHIIVEQTAANLLGEGRFGRVYKVSLLSSAFHPSSYCAFIPTMSLFSASMEHQCILSMPSSRLLSFPV